MRCTCNLYKLNLTVFHRLRRLRKLYDSGQSKDVSQAARDIAYIAIELDNLILSANRQFMISSLTKARSATGLKVTSNPSFKNEGEVAAYILKILAPVSYKAHGYPSQIKRGDEFKVRDPRLIVNVMSSCSASNILSVQAAYAYKSAVFTELPVIRNFYAHRNDDTWRKVRARALTLGVYGPQSAYQILTARLPSRPVTLIEDWIDDIELFFYQLTY